MTWFRIGCTAISYSIYDIRTEEEGVGPKGDVICVEVARIFLVPQNYSLLRTREGFKIP